MLHILENMEAFNVQLVNNLEFLTWATTTPNPFTFPDQPPLPAQELPDDIKDAFLTANGASPFETVEDLKKALKVLFNYRVGEFLEIIALPGLAPLPDISTCSDITFDIGSDVGNDWFNGVFVGVDLNNERSFYVDMVLEYV